MGALGFLNDVVQKNNIEVIPLKIYVFDNSSIFSNITSTTTYTIPANSGETAYFKSSDIPENATILGIKDIGLTGSSSGYTLPLAITGVRLSNEIAIDFYNLTSSSQDINLYYSYLNVVCAI